MWVKKKGIFIQMILVWKCVGNTKQKVVRLNVFSVSLLIALCLGNREEQEIFYKKFLTLLSIISHLALCNYCGTNQLKQEQHDFPMPSGIVYTN